MGPVLDELVRAKARLAGPAVHQRIVEIAHMAAGHPDLPVHQNGAVKPHIIFAFLHKFLPPRALDIVFEFDAQRAIIPGVGQAAVDFRSRKHKTPPLAQGNDLVHPVILHLCHGKRLTFPVLRGTRAAPVSQQNRAKAPPPIRAPAGFKGRKASFRGSTLVGAPVRAHFSFSCFCSGLPTPSSPIASLSY